MSLANKLVTVAPRESSATADRYAYQAMWGLALLFREHNFNDDYAIVFEFHDDVALLNSATSPTTVRFYQVKSRANSTGWGLAALANRTKEKNASGKIVEKPSIIEKIYDSIEKFSNAVISVDFVSNRHCTLKYGKTAFRFSDCNPADFAKLVASVKAGYPAATSAQIALLGFTQTDLSLEDMTAHTRGKLQAFIAAELGDVRFSPETVYRSVIDHCRRKAEFKGPYANLGEALEKKGITKATVEAWLAEISANHQSPAWSEISPRLTIPFADERKISREYNLYQAAALDSSDRAMQRVRMAIRTKLPEVVDDSSLSFSDMVDKIYAAVETVGQKYIKPSNPHKLKAMIIYEIYTCS